MNTLLVQFRNNNTAHDDLHIWIEGYSRTADSYYLALDNAMLADDESPDKVRRVLVQLLQRWIGALALATQTHPAYLPFDFSDQYTGCLQCRPDGNFIEVVPGTSYCEGWGLRPSDPGDYFFGITDFQRDAPFPVRLPKEEFLQRIQESIADIESQLLKADEHPH